MKLPPPGNNAPPLRGMLHKRHQNSRFSNWGKRYFEVDDERGILFYFRTKAAQEWDEPARHFSLSALRDCRALEIPSHTFGLEVTLVAAAHTPPHKLVLRAKSQAEHQRWLAGLQSRIDLQRKRFEAGVPPHAPGSPPPSLEQEIPPEYRLRDQASPSMLRRGGAPSAEHPTGNPPPTSGVALSPGHGNVRPAWDQPRVALSAQGGGTSPTRARVGCESAASAIAAATLAATRAAARAEAAASANEICQAMGAVGEASPKLLHKRDIDIERFLEQRQREVWAQLAEDEENSEEVPDETTESMLSALGATPREVQGISGGGGRSRRGSVNLAAEAMDRAVGELSPRGLVTRSQLEYIGEKYNVGEELAAGSENRPMLLTEAGKLAHVGAHVSAGGYGRNTPGACGLPPAALAFGLERELDACGV